MTRYVIDDLSTWPIRTGNADCEWQPRVTGEHIPASRGACEYPGGPPIEPDQPEAFEIDTIEVARIAWDAAKDRYVVVSPWVEMPPGLLTAGMLADIESDCLESLRGRAERDRELADEARAEMRRDAAMAAE